MFWTLRDVRGALPLQLGAKRDATWFCNNFKEWTKGFTNLYGCAESENENMVMSALRSEQSQAARKKHMVMKRKML